MAEQKSKWWLWAGLGAAGLWFLHSRASAGAVGGVQTSGSNKDQLQQMMDWATAILAKYGFGVVPSYVTDHSATAEIVDTTGRNRVLHLKDQAATDAFHTLVWNYNAAYKFNVWDPNTGVATGTVAWGSTPTWADTLAAYNTIKAKFTPEFLA